MKRYLVLALAALALAIAAPSAFATRVIFDPPPPSPASGIAPPAGTDCTLSAGGLNDYTPCNINQINTAYAVTFVDCSTLPGLNPPAQGWCLFMTNVTRRSLNTFNFQFTAPSGGSSDGSDLLTCGSQPPGFASDNCQDGATVTAGDFLDLSFFAPLANNTNFYLITDFVNQPGPATVTVSVPEPSELGLFGLGLLILGVGFVWQKRRQAQTSRSNEAV
ncbi:MAG TPA: PEP-CTERM sorting domain-containing protein [Rhodanobacteraceae bacterium]|nr:PEP-CTERM sorting domain-containing protein [Rhodanobacteraceae bacterium]